MGAASVWSAGACRDTCTRPRDTARILLSRAWRRPAFPSIWVAQRCISRLAGPFDAAAARRAFFAARFSRASNINVSHIGQKIQQISSCSPRAAPVLRTGGAISSGDRRPTSSRLGFSRPALSKYRRASAGVHRSMSSVIARRSVPAQPCFMLASAFRVTYGEAGVQCASARPSQQHVTYAEFDSEQRAQQTMLRRLRVGRAAEVACVVGQEVRQARLRPTLSARRHEARRRREEPVTAVAAFCYSTQILGAKVGTRHVHYRTTVRLFLHNTIAYGFRVLVSNTNPLNRATHHTGQAERT